MLVEKVDGVNLMVVTGVPGPTLSQSLLRGAGMEFLIGQVWDTPIWEPQVISTQTTRTESAEGVVSKGRSGFVR